MQAGQALGVTAIGLDLVPTRAPGINDGATTSQRTPRRPSIVGPPVEKAVAGEFGEMVGVKHIEKKVVSHPSIVG
jgi:hypothetical protein